MDPKHIFGKHMCDNWFCMRPMNRGADTRATEAWSDNQGTSGHQGVGTKARAPRRGHQTGTRETEAVSEKLITSEHQGSGTSGHQAGSRATEANRGDLGTKA